MNLKILFLIILYWVIWGMVFVVGSRYTLDKGYSYNADLNSSGLSSGEVDRGGLFNMGVSFSRYYPLILFGIGLPSTTPTWFVTIFAFWQILFNIFSAGFVISSIWDG